MKRIIKLTLLLTVLALFHTKAFANDDRAGQAGATQLLIDPWASSSGWNGVHTAGVRGVEAMRYNAGGIVNAHENTEITFSRTSWLTGSEIYINALGFTQKMGDDGASALGISIVSMNFGDIEVTTTEMPDGDLGTYSPQFLNIGVAYSRMFSHNIRAGLVTRIISESVPDANAQGIALDAGVQYVTGLNDRMRFGISLRNVGPPMRYSGDGLAVRGSFDGVDFDLTLDQRSQSFELPSQLTIGLAYDIFLDDTLHGIRHRLTPAATFFSNSFSSDQLGAGLEYTYRDLISVRGGYIYEFNELFSDQHANVFSGPAAGASLYFRLGEEAGGMRIGVDYSYRPTPSFDGTHNIGASLKF